VLTELYGPIWLFLSLNSGSVFDIFGIPRCFLRPSSGVVELVCFLCFWRFIIFSDLSMKRLLATSFFIKKPISSGMVLLFQCVCISEEGDNFDFFCKWTDG